MRTYAWIALAVAIPCAGGQCLRDAAGNTICVSTETDTNICGYPMKILGSIYGQTFYCHDIVVEKKTPDGQAVYRRVLGGNSEDTPASLFCDAQGNAVLLGTTWSSDFPVTADAAQKAYAGPPPSIGTGYALAAGGDLAVTVLDPAGNLLYATFAGSSGNDLILGTRDAGGAQAEVLVHAGASDFPITLAAATSGGPVLITYDLTRRAPLRSAYLPVGGVAYTAELLGDGTVRVTTAGGVYTFGADGALRMLLPLDSFAFREIPYLSFDGSGDLWLVGRNTSGVPVVAKFTGGTVEAFRWSPPVNTAEPYAGYAYLVSPFFGPDGLVYLRGTGKLQSTTPNALLEAPCAAYDLGMVAVLSSQGEVKLVSYVAGNPQSFAVDEQGGVVLVETDGTRVPMDLAQRPKAGCVRDVLERYNGGPPFAAGQVVRLRGGGLGPELEAVGVPGADGRFGTLLSGVTVEVDGIAAPILSVQAGEAVFAIPGAATEGDTVPVTVSDGGQASRALPVAVRHLAPHQVEPVFNGDGTPNTFEAPAEWGSAITTFVTGAGPYSPALLDGQIAPPTVARSLALPVTAAFQMTGPDPEAAEVLYAGPAPGYLGLAQINVRLPAARPYPYSSILPLVTIGGVRMFVPSVWVK